MAALSHAFSMAFKMVLTDTDFILLTHGDSFTTGRRLANSKTILLLVPRRIYMYHTKCANDFKLLDISPFSAGIHPGFVFFFIAFVFQSRFQHFCRPHVRVEGS